MKNPPLILICDDEEMVCEALSDALCFGQSRQWGQLSSLNMAVAHHLNDVKHKYRVGFIPDLAYVDLQLFQERLGGLKVAKFLRQKNPDVKIIFMTHYTHQLNAEDFAEIAALSPEACINKHQGFAGSIVKYLIHCGEQVMMGKNCFATEWEVYFYQDDTPTLKGRQKEVAKLRAQKLSPKTIAERLNVTPSTVYTNLSRIEEHLGFNCPQKLLSYCKHKSWL